eukprot:Em0405g1a
MVRLDGRACGSAGRGAQLPLFPFQARWLGHLAPPAYGGAAYRVVRLPRLLRSWQCNKCGGSYRLVWGFYWEGMQPVPVKVVEHIWAWKFQTGKEIHRFVVGKAVRAGFHELELEKPEAKRRKRRSPKWPLLDKELYLWFSRNICAFHQPVIALCSYAPVHQPGIAHCSYASVYHRRSHASFYQPAITQCSHSSFYQSIAVTPPSTSLSLFKSTTPPSGDDSTAGNKQILSHG